MVTSQNARMLQGHTSNIFIFLILSLLFFQSCGPTVVYEDIKKISADGWTFGEQVCFPFEVTDTVPLYELALQVTTTEDYKYQNIYVRVHTAFPHQPPSQQVLSLELRDDTGLAKGQCSGERCVTRIPLQETTYFSAPGAYSLCFEPYMRDTVVAGVESLKLSLVRKKGGRE